MMIEYPKINSLWKREGWYFDQDIKKNTPPEHQKKRQSFIVGDYACDEFYAIKTWHITEKIDGTNIRIHWDGIDKITFGGRTPDAQIPTHLLIYLQQTFTKEEFNVFIGEEVLLFGEGYGPKIQKVGGNYRADPGFILFDVIIDGWWLEQLNVEDVAKKFWVPTAPYLGVMKEDEIVEYVKSKPKSYCSIIEQEMEGIIARSNPQMLFRAIKQPIMFKLKCKDFE